VTSGYSDQQHNKRERYYIGEEPPKSKLRRFFKWFLILAVLGGVIVILALKTGFTFSQIIIDFSNGGGKLPTEQPFQDKDPNRLNVLLLGLRGENDPHGGLLTDSIMLVSVEKKSGKIALISIPRDLYVKIPGTDTWEKINSAHAYGEEKKRGSGGILYSKAIVSDISGLYIDYAVSVNHEAFRETVDAIGGIDIYLDKPFVENKQFTDEIILDLPAGKNHLDGRTALFFVRSRYTTSDFDRMRRQQQVLLAIKDKVLSLGVLANPVKIFNLLSIVGRNIKTDMSAGDIQSFINLASDIDKEHVIKKVFDTTPEGLLHSATAENGAYILLPNSGNYDQIREACRSVFN
jgi:LCP family protein required for cell wall assembly